MFGLCVSNLPLLHSIVRDFWKGIAILPVAFSENLGLQYYVARAACGNSVRAACRVVGCRCQCFFYRFGGAHQSASGCFHLKGPSYK